MNGYISFILCLLLAICFAVIAETSSASASSSSDEYENDDRLLASDRNDSTNANDTLLRGHGVGQERLMRRDQSKDLKRLIQELEESDYSNYGSWGNFRSRPSPPPSHEKYPTPDAGVYRGPEMTLHEHEEFWDDPDGGSSIVHSDDSYHTANRHHHHYHSGFGPRYSGGGLTGRHSRPQSPPHEYNPNYPLDDVDADAYHQYQRDQRHHRPPSSESWEYRDVAAGSSGSTAAWEDIRTWEDAQGDEETRLLPYQPYQSHDPYNFNDNNYMHAHRLAQTNQAVAHYQQQMTNRNRELAATAGNSALSISGLDPKRELQFHSVVSLTSILVFCAISAYLSVTPRLPSATGSAAALAAAGENRLLDLFSSFTSVEHDSTLLSAYNHHFKELFLRVLVGTFAPWMVMTKVFRRCDANINQVIHTFVRSFTIGYVSTVVIEVIVATCIRLVVLRWLEPSIFRLCPHIPDIFLPWQLRECDATLTQGGTHISHMTRIIISLLTTCIAVPVLEEYIKLVLFRWNFPVTSPSAILTNTINTQQQQLQPEQPTHDRTRKSLVQPPPTNPVRACIIGTFTSCLNDDSYYRIGLISDTLFSPITFPCP